MLPLSSVPKACGLRCHHRHFLHPTMPGPPDLREMLRWLGTSAGACYPESALVLLHRHGTRPLGPWLFPSTALGASSLKGARESEQEPKPTSLTGRMAGLISAPVAVCCSGPCDHVRSCNKSAALKPLGGHAADWAALTVAGGGHSLERSCMSCALSCCVAQVWQLEPLQIQTDRVSSVHDLIPFFRPGGKFLDSSLDGFFVRLVPARAAPTYQLTLLREPIWCFRVSGTGASASTLSRKQPEQ